MTTGNNQNNNGMKTYSKHTVTKLETFQFYAVYVCVLSCPDNLIVAYPKA